MVTPPYGGLTGGRVKLGVPKTFQCCNLTDSNGLPALEYSIFLAQLNENPHPVETGVSFNITLLSLLSISLLQ